MTSRTRTWGRATSRSRARGTTSASGRSRCARARRSSATKAIRAGRVASLARGGARMAALSARPRGGGGRSPRFTVSKRNGHSLLAAASMAGGTWCDRPSTRFDPPPLRRGTPVRSSTDRLDSLAGGLAWFRDRPWIYIYIYISVRSSVGCLWFDRPWMRPPRGRRRTVPFVTPRRGDALRPGRPRARVDHRRHQMTTTPDNTEPTEPRQTTTNEGFFLCVGSPKPPGCRPTARAARERTRIFVDRGSSADDARNLPRDALRARVVSAAERRRTHTPSPPTTTRPRTDVR